jgi:hypothetical protein
VEIKESKDHEM